jgi:peptidyl-prolyl cis-trans isomerase B (cyclophilin B)
VPEQANPVVELETSAGSMKIELYPDKAPDTVSNFLAYVDEGYYDGTIFHRVISKFMIQGGGFTADMQEKETRDPVKNEADNGLGNERGAIAMARTSDPHSATAQFFINTVDTNSFLDHSSKTTRGWGYCVFGKVTEGMDAVDAIRGVATARRGMHDDVPVEPVVISSIKRA